MPGLAWLLPWLTATLALADQPPIPLPCAGSPIGQAISVSPIEARAPRYLDPLWKAGVAGEVRLRVNVSPDGSVAGTPCLVRSVNALADRYTAQAAIAWRFPPAVVARYAELSFQFVFEAAPQGLSPGPTGVLFKPALTVVVLAARDTRTPAVSVSSNAP
jgi:TonB family protein